jgi:hypothetical protein
MVNRLLDRPNLRNDLFTPEETKDNITINIHDHSIHDYSTHTTNTYYTTFLPSEKALTKRPFTRIEKWTIALCMVSAGAVIYTADLPGCVDALNKLIQFAR